MDECRFRQRDYSRDAALPLGSVLSADTWETVPGVHIASTTTTPDDPPVVARRGPVYHGQLRRLSAWFQALPQVAKASAMNASAPGSEASGFMPGHSGVGPHERLTDPAPGGPTRGLERLYIDSVVADTLELPGGVSMHFYREYYEQSVPGNYPAALRANRAGWPYDHRFHVEESGGSEMNRGGPSSIAASVNALPLLS
jgi:hypothetical protein